MKNHIKEVHNYPCSVCAYICITKKAIRIPLECWRLQFSRVWILWFQCAYMWAFVYTYWPQAQKRKQIQTSFQAFVTQGYVQEVTHDCNNFTDVRNTVNNVILPTCWECRWISAIKTLSLYHHLMSEKSKCYFCQTKFSLWPIQKRLLNNPHSAFD